jgi:DNA-binding MarR family transcriptional regulator/N-acetylglutamate synthase-like GNAT family acetyltransferase
MDKQVTEMVQQIRAFNRFYTRILGLLQDHILDSDYTLAEVRVLLEIGSNAECTATLLIGLLGLDGGYLSRILKRFVREGLVVSQKSTTDGRVSLLLLTDVGRVLLDRLVAATDRQIADRIACMSTKQQGELVGHMQAVQRLLSGVEQGAPVIRTCRPGDLAYVDYLHCRVYGEEYGFDLAEFERYVLPPMVKFIEQPDKEGSQSWVAEFAGSIVGGLTALRVDTETAQLRWFVVDPSCRGLGVGKELMGTAIDFCRTFGYKRVFLWTVDYLKAARHIYQREGFVLTESVRHSVWGQDLVEERWDLGLGS